MNCPIHGVPFKTVPAGVSKSTGRPYNAFEACPERGCKEKPPKVHSTGGYVAPVGSNAAPTITTTNGISFGQGERIIELLEKIAGL